jgi:7-keto-8-aminopelargonate synthetase-like enzyme
MTLNEAIRHELDRLEETKTFKKETLIESEQGPVVRVGGRDVVMLASNNYLGLASHPRIKEAALRGVREYGHGVAFVFFVERRRFTGSSRKRSPSSWGPRTRFSIPPASPPMKDFSLRSSTRSSESSTIAT